MNRKVVEITIQVSNINEDDTLEIDTGYESQSVSIFFEGEDVANAYMEADDMADCIHRLSAGG